MSITICGLDEIGGLNLSTFDHVISIRDPQDVPIEMKHESIHTFKFKDYRKKRKPDKQTRVPEIEDVERLVKILRKFKKDDTILIHCNQGHSRSPAFAYVAFREFGCTPQEARDTVRNIRSGARPNQRIVNIYEAFS